MTKKQLRGEKWWGVGEVNTVEVCKTEGSNGSFLMFFYKKENFAKYFCNFVVQLARWARELKHFSISHRQKMSIRAITAKNSSTVYLICFLNLNFLVRGCFGAKCFKNSRVQLLSPSKIANKHVLTKNPPPPDGGGGRRFSSC